MRNFRKWTWQTWAILVMGALVAGGQIVALNERWNEREVMRARLALPTTADLFHVSYVTLDRSEDGHLVVYTDAHAREAFVGRFKVALRDRDTYRHVWTPEWSGWINYAANPDGSHYRQPETLQWWADYPDFVEPPARAWVMETCWQAVIRDPALGMTELEPVCATSLLDKAQNAPQATAP